MELGYLPDVVRTDVLDLDSIPDRAVEVLALRAFGMGAVKIARVLNISRTTVEGYFKRYDPDNECRISYEAKRRITSEMLIGTGVSALVEITDEKLRESDAKDLAAIAGRCINTAEKIRLLSNLPKNDGTSRVDSMLDSLETAHIEEQ